MISDLTPEKLLILESIRVKLDPLLVERFLWNVKKGHIHGDGRSSGDRVLEQMAKALGKLDLKERGRPSNQWKGELAGLIHALKSKGMKWKDIKVVCDAWSSEHGHPILALGTLKNLYTNHKVGVELAIALSKGSQITLEFL